MELTRIGLPPCSATTRRELKSALDQARETRDRFSLIEVMLPRGLVSDTMARYAAGFKAKKRAAEEAAKRASMDA